MPQLGTRLIALCLLLTMILMPALPPRAAVAQSATPATEDVEANKALVRQFFEIAATGHLEDLRGLTTPDFVISTAPPGESPNLDGLIGTFAAVRTGLPDFSMRVDDLIAEDDLIVSRTTIRGTHLGDFFGAPPTGKTIETVAIDLWRVEDGKLAENWHLEDILGVMEQLGAGPLAATPAASPPAAGEPAPAPVAEGTPDAAAMAANVETAHRFRTELFAQGDETLVEDILAPGFAWHGNAEAGPAESLALAAATRTAFPDLALTIDQIVAEGDRVAVLWTMRGTHQGEYAGVPGSGNQIVTPGIDIYRFADGRIAEAWTVGDDLGLLMQLGAFPRFGSEAAATPNT